MTPIESKFSLLSQRLYIGQSKLVIVMKSDKEKKKKKASASSVALKIDSPSNSSPRVTNQINIPVRQQIAWAKARQRLLTQSSQSFGQTTRFRQDKAEKKAEEEYVEVDYHNLKPPVVFVDGYNIIGFINSMQKRTIDMADARDCLISDLSVLKGATGWDIEVIFDAYQVLGPEKKVIQDGILVTYTSKQETADSHIERRFYELKSEGFQNMIVATDDTVLRMVAGSNGAGYLPASSLLEEMRIAYRGWELMAEDTIIEVRTFF